MTADQDENLNLQWLIPENETQPVWDLFESAFSVFSRQSEEPFDGNPPFFANSQWQVVGLVNNLESLSIPPYGPDEVLEGWIKMDQWEQHLELASELDIGLSRNGFYERDELGPLIDIVAEDGAHTLYFTEVLQQRPGAFQAGAASRAGLEAAARSLLDSKMGYGLQLNFVFDNTARWGLYISEDNIAFLAAEANLMERYLPEVGGLEVLQERFADRVGHEVDPERAFYRVRAARVCRLWYAYMRWPWPFPAPPL